MTTLRDGDEITFPSLSGNFLVFYTPQGGTEMSGKKSKRSDRKASFTVW